MNLTTVRLSPLLRSGSTLQEPVDDHFGEPTGPYQRMASTITTEAQLVYEKHEKNTTLFSGDTVPITGRLVFETTTLNTALTAAGINELKNGDMITGIAEDTSGSIRDVEYLIVEVRPTAQLKTGYNIAVPATTTAFFTNNTEAIAASKAVR